MQTHNSSFNVLQALHGKSNQNDMNSNLNFDSVDIVFKQNGVEGKSMPTIALDHLYWFHK